MNGNQEPPDAMLSETPNRRTTVAHCPGAPKRPSSHAVSAEVKPDKPERQRPSKWYKARSNAKSILAFTFRQPFDEYGSMIKKRKKPESEEVESEEVDSKTPKLD